MVHINENDIINKFKEISRNVRLYYNLKNDFKSDISQKYLYYERTFYNDNYPKYEETLQQEFFKECLNFLNTLLNNYKEV